MWQSFSCAVLWFPINFTVLSFSSEYLLTLNIYSIFDADTKHWEKNLDCRCECIPSTVLLSFIQWQTTRMQLLQEQLEPEINMKSEKFSKYFQTDGSQLWITAWNKKGDLFKIRGKSLIWQQFGRNTTGPPCSVFDLLLLGSTPIETSTGKWKLSVRTLELRHPHRTWASLLMHTKSFWWKVR